MNVINPLLLKSALELVAPDGISVADFKIYSGLNDKYGLGFEDHRRGLSYLLSHGYVIENNGYLSLGHLTKQDWLIDELIAGESVAWSFVDTFPKTRWKFNPDDSLNSEIGLQGELFVIEQLQKTLDPDLHQRIIHSSHFDDGLGFDIEAPSQNEHRGTVFLEVKTSSRPGQEFNFYLSRNEASVGSRIRNWYLVFVKIDNDKPRLLGYCPYSEISHNLPANRDVNFEWQSTSARIHESDLFVGLP